MSSNIVIDGTITKDIEIKTTSYGEVLTLNIASNLGRDETAWYQVSVWGKLAEIMKDRLGAKDRVLITGDLKKVNAYTKRDGTAGAQIDVQANKVRLLLSSADKELIRANKPQESGQYQRQQAPQQPQRQQAPKGNGTWGQQPQQPQQHSNNSNNSNNSNGTMDGTGNMTKDNHKVSHFLKPLMADGIKVDKIKRHNGDRPVNQRQDRAMILSRFDGLAV